MKSLKNKLLALTLCGFALSTVITPIHAEESNTSDVSDTLSNTYEILYDKDENRNEEIDSTLSKIKSNGNLGLEFSPFYKTPSLTKEQIAKIAKKDINLTISAGKNNLIPEFYSMSFEKITNPSVELDLTVKPLVKNAKISEQLPGINSIYDISSTEDLPGVMTFIFPLAGPIDSIVNSRLPMYVYRFNEETQQVEYMDQEAKSFGVGVTGKFTISKSGLYAISNTKPSDVVKKPVEPEHDEFSKEIENLKHGDVYVIPNKDNPILSKEQITVLGEKGIKIQYNNDTYNIIIKNITNRDVSFNPLVTLGAKNDYVEKQLNGKNMIIDFAHNGILPGTMDVTVKTTFEKNAKIYLYYYNPTSMKVEYQNQIATVTNDGMASFAITHCSQYILSDVNPKTIETKVDNDTIIKSTGSNKTGSSIVFLSIISVIGYVFLKKLRTMEFK